MRKTPHIETVDKTAGQGPLGRHLTVEFYDCNHEEVSSPSLLEKILLSATQKSGATIINSHFYQFQPQGVSGVVIIAESHLTVHTWPEYDFAAIDIFTCGDSINFNAALEELKQGLQSNCMLISNDMNRGFPKQPAIESIQKMAAADQCLYDLEERFHKGHFWGISSAIDISSCNLGFIQDADKIKQFTKELCKHIQMTPFGETTVVHFGKDKKVAGFSMTQLIESSLISGHFANESSKVYLDIFSCKYYNPRDAAIFATDFFEGETYNLQISLRK